MRHCAEKCGIIVHKIRHRSDKLLEPKDTGGWVRNRDAKKARDHDAYDVIA